MKYVDVDTFRSRLRAGQRAAPVARLSTVEPEVVSPTSRTIRFCFSDGTVDRTGDRINPFGWDVNAFSKNPVVLWAHDSLAPPIGRSSRPWVSGNRLLGDISFADAEAYEFADTIFRLVQGGFIRAVSVGFLPLDYVLSDDPDRPYGIDFKSQELLEISVVPVPANANALQEARAKGIDTRLIERWRRPVEDRYTASLRDAARGIARAVKARIALGEATTMAPEYAAGYRPAAVSSISSQDDARALAARVARRQADLETLAGNGRGAAEFIAKAERLEGKHATAPHPLQVQAWLRSALHRW